MPTRVYAGVYTHVYTRVKGKLVVVGSTGTLRKGGAAPSAAHLACLLELLEQRGWMYRLPAGALHM